MVEPAIPVASNTTGDPVSPAAEALRLFGPGVAPRVQLVTVATPPASVLMGDVGSTLPPPAVTWNVTGTPATGLLSASVTTTAGDTGTALPAPAVWSSPPFCAMLAAAPADRLMVPEVTGVRLGEVNVRV